MRALLVANPAATTTSTRTRNVIAAALAAECKLDVAETRSRGDGISLGAQAADDRFDAVIVLGGDGTVNEVVNGLLHRWKERPTGAGPLHDSLPALGIVPGGHTNVLARSLGLPRNPIDATASVLDALTSGSRRRIGLGRADDRWFTFCAGLGIDAAVVARIERLRAAGGRVTGRRYVSTTLAEFLTTIWHRQPQLSVETLDGTRTPGVHIALVTNTSPWTYLGDWPMDPCPEASFEQGLDMFAITSSGLTTTLRAVRRMLPAARGASGRPRRPTTAGVKTWHDEASVTIRARVPLPFQVDGEYAGVRDVVQLRAVPDSLSLLM